MVAPAQAVAQNLVDVRYDTAPIPPWPEPNEWIGQLDRALLGFSRDWHHKYLLGGVAARAIRIERAGALAGYAYISAEGRVGPLAIAKDADARAVVTTALYCALESKPSRVSMIVPGRADVVIQTASALGFRIEEPLILMAVRPFGDWTNYLPRDPGFL
jgi:hypothetical protein